MLPASTGFFPVLRTSPGRGGVVPKPHGGGGIVLEMRAPEDRQSQGRCFRRHRTHPAKTAQGGAASVITLKPSATIFTRNIASPTSPRRFCPVRSRKSPC